MTEPGATEPGVTEPGATTAAPVARRRLRSSILYKVVGVLVVTLVVSSVLTAIIASRLTSTALTEQAKRIATGQLTVLQEAFADRERHLVASMRNLAETVSAGRLVDPARRTDLISELNRASGNFDLDVIRILDPDGAELSPPAGVGTMLAAPSIFSGVSSIVEPGSRLLATSDGKYVQAVAVPIGSGPNPSVLVGAYLFDDAFAYRLRRQIGSLDNVLLVASGRVAGSSLPEPPVTPPGREESEGARTRTMTPSPPASCRASPPSSAWVGSRAWWPTSRSVATSTTRWVAPWAWP